MFRIFSSCAVALSLCASGSAQGWACYGANAQHTGVFTGSIQPLQQIRWQAPLDDDRNYYGSEVLIHYASPMITPANTVVYGYRYTTTAGGSTDYDNWSIEARTGSTGASTWKFRTDYSAALIWPNDW